MPTKPPWHVLVVQITPEQYAKLAAVAREHDRSLAWLVRNLIEKLLPGRER